MDDRDEYYKRKEAKQYNGGGGIYRLLFGFLFFGSSIYFRDDISVLELIGLASIGIVLITFGFYAYHKAFIKGYIDK